MFRERNRFGYGRSEASQLRMPHWSIGQSNPKNGIHRSMWLITSSKPIVLKFVSSEIGLPAVEVRTLGRAAVRETVLIARLVPIRQGSHQIEGQGLVVVPEVLLPTGL